MKGLEHMRDIKLGVRKTEDVSIFTRINKLVDRFLDGLTPMADEVTSINGS